MCLFIYTLPQLCKHLCFQNVSECAVARGIPPSQESSLTLREPVFLFDTMRSTSRTPEYYSQRFSCKKRRAVRPVPTLCERCVGGTSAADMLAPTSPMSDVHNGGTYRVRVDSESGLQPGPDERMLLAAKDSTGSLSRRSDSSGM